MKKFLAILVVAILATSFSFSQTVNDNSTTTKTGTGSFTCDVLTALVVTGGGDLSTLGEFVVAALPYTTFNTGSDIITFTIAGQNNHGFYYKLSATTTTTEASIQVTWSDPLTATWLPLTLSSTGGYTITGTVTSLTALASGTATFPVNLTVSYNNL